MNLLVTKEIIHTNQGLAIKNQPTRLMATKQTSLFSSLIAISIWIITILKKYIEF